MRWCMNAALQTHENNREANSETGGEVWHFEEERGCRIMWPVGTQTRADDLLLLALIILTQRRQQRQHLFPDKKSANRHPSRGLNCRSNPWVSPIISERRGSNSFNSFTRRIGTNSDEIYCPPIPFRHSDLPDGQFCNLKKKTIKRINCFLISK